MESIDGGWFLIGRLGGPPKTSSKEETGRLLDRAEADPDPREEEDEDFMGADLPCGRNPKSRAKRPGKSSIGRAGGGSGWGSG